MNIQDYEKFDRENAYYGNDLGALIIDDKTQFKVWAPNSSAVFLNLYSEGEGNNLIESIPMQRLEKGVWSLIVSKNLDGRFYTYTFEYDGQRIETIDIYAKACGINGDRGAVIDFKTTDPDNWENVRSPKCKSPCDAIIYETNVRDFSIDKTSGVTEKNRGKFLAFTESGTSYNGTKTCLEHLKSLGITHIHLLPVFDFATIDEKIPITENKNYNWGYDPKNYNCLEGSYSTNPYDPKTRIVEFKKLVQTLHENNIGVIMDVVYNHTYESEKSSFHKTFPFYYHRTSHNWFSNGSGCGNELASERAMVRKFILDSVEFWAKEYKIDGFRFDLMGLIDIETVNLIRDKLTEINPQILMYGEGWTGGESPYSSQKLAYKWNSYQFARVGLFNDNLRDAVKGAVFNIYDKGFVSGNLNAVNIIKRGLVGSIPHSQLNENYEACFAYNPTQTVNYCEAHDNHTLWDKLTVSSEQYTLEQRIKMDKLCAAIVILAQGIPFLELGQDFLRSKPMSASGKETLESKYNPFNGNSYNAPDETNSIKWNQKSENIGIFKYYKALIALRKKYPQFRLSKRDDVESQMRFFDTGDNNIIGYSLTDAKSVNSSVIVVLLNPYTDSRVVNIPEGEYTVLLNSEGTDGSKLKKIICNKVEIDSISALVLLKK